MYYVINRPIRKQTSKQNYNDMIRQMLQFWTLNPEKNSKWNNLNNKVLFLFFCLYLIRIKVDGKIKKFMCFFEHLCTLKH